MEFTNCNIALENINKDLIAILAHLGARHIICDLEVVAKIKDLQYYTQQAINAK